MEAAEYPFSENAFRAAATSFARFSSINSTRRFAIAFQSRRT
jgi:hypothetical protein